jgi:hypothetical protein
VGTVLFFAEVSIHENKPGHSFIPGPAAIVGTTGSFYDRVVPRIPWRITRVSLVRIFTLVTNLSKPNPNPDQTLTLEGRTLKNKSRSWLKNSNFN